MSEKTTFYVEVASVTQTERVSLDASGNENERTVHKVVAKNEDGQKIVFESPDELPWRVKWPLAVVVEVTQANLDEFEEGKK